MIYNYLNQEPKKSIERQLELRVEGIELAKQLVETPGPNTLIAGSTSAGFFGEVPSSEFITGDALASMIGLTAGVSQYSDTPWLKFILDGKILFTPKKPIRHGISRNDINAVNAVYGNRTVTIKGQTYKIRLWKGALTDPSKDTDPDRGAIGSEWNRLMLPIHEKAPSSWKYPEFSGTTEDWNINYTDEDLLTQYNYGNGSYTWCQETSESYHSDCVIRGYDTVSSSYYIKTSVSDKNCGWRPVLELVDDNVTKIPETPGLHVINDSKIFLKYDNKNLTPIVVPSENDRSYHVVLGTIVLNEGQKLLGVKPNGGYITSFNDRSEDGYLEFVFAFRSSKEPTSVSIYLSKTDETYEVYEFERNGEKTDVNIKECPMNTLPFKPVDRKFRVFVFRPYIPTELVFVHAKFLEKAQKQLNNGQTYTFVSYNNLKTLRKLAEEAKQKGYCVATHYFDVAGKEQLSNEQLFFSRVLAEYFDFIHLSYNNKTTSRYYFTGKTTIPARKQNRQKPKAKTYKQSK